MAGDGREGLAFLTLGGALLLTGLALNLGVSGLIHVFGAMGRDLSGSHRGNRFAHGLVRLVGSAALLVLVFYWLVWSLFRF